MIPNQWYAILESDEVRPGKPLGVTRLGENLVLWRSVDGQPACLVDRCVHRGAALSLGKVHQNDVACPFHGFRFDPAGRCTLIPANGKDVPPPRAFQVPSYPVQDAFGWIWLWWGAARQELPSIGYFDAITPEMSYATLRDLWKTHYSRAIENQLDVVHLPFVHHNTIGRGRRTLVDGPLTRWDCTLAECDLLNLWVSNRQDDGSTPQRPDQLPEPARRPSLQFRYPNVWHNWISDRVHIVAAFAPVDDENTLLYIRMYQSVVRAPLLRQLFDQAGRLANLVIERQDRRIVETQLPKRSHLRMGEKLIQGDGPIIAYRRRREELIHAGGR
ncbi:MAG: aromatic ring-hydroxylating dioxygenase subunit alpha [Anaerolineaceae bacterium]|nr:aromatic ring-hydroxylating dioxygenase subunit alpha [Anaerolineaceae bacterium]